MEDIKYLSKHHRCMAEGEIRGEEPTNTPSLVDPKGYVPLRKQVERAVANGERLVAFRRGEYDSDAEDYEGDPSPILDPDFMPSVDMPALAEAQKRKYETARANAEVEALAKAKAEAQQSPSDSSVGSAPNVDGE